jgi:hypothetical protein
MLSGLRGIMEVVVGNDSGSRRWTRLLEGCYPGGKLLPKLSIAFDSSVCLHGDEKVRKKSSFSMEDVKASRYDSMFVTSRFFDELSFLLRTRRQTHLPRSGTLSKSTEPPVHLRFSDRRWSRYHLGISFSSTSDDSGLQ